MAGVTGLPCKTQFLVNLDLKLLVKKSQTVLWHILRLQGPLAFGRDIKVPFIKPFTSKSHQILFEEMNSTEHIFDM